MVGELGEGIPMPELGSLDNKQAASLAGLVPVARHSGQWKGKSFIRGGRANVRQALYMPAPVAGRFNPDLKSKYQQLIAAGKPAKIAITAVMHKLVVTPTPRSKLNASGSQHSLDYHEYSRWTGSDGSRAGAKPSAEGKQLGRHQFKLLDISFDVDNGIHRHRRSHHQLLDTGLGEHGAILP